MMMIFRDVVKKSQLGKNITIRRSVHRCVNEPLLHFVSAVLTRVIEVPIVVAYPSTLQVNCKFSADV
jgi:hypothetical protein